MAVFFVLLIWMAIIFIETGAIIFLAVLNSKYRSKIAELTEQLRLKGGTPGGNIQKETASAGPITRIPVPPVQAGIPVPVKDGKIAPIQRIPIKPVEVNPGENVNTRPRNDKSDNPKPDIKFVPGTAALIIGVVFVVLAGLIFATTAWHTLPSFSKVVMIFGFSCVFFGTSRVAGKIFKIEKTSQAFYILGSVFLFLTILAAGYFKLFGFNFTMEEQHRFKVLWAGSLATELAMLAGVRQFKDRIYTKACLWGMTVTMFFFIKAFSLGTADSIKAMACYSPLLFLADELTKKKREMMPSYLNADITSFAELHFWIFSVLMAVIAAAEWLVFISKHLFHSEAAVSLLTTLALGMIAAGIAVMVLKRGRQYLQIMFSISMIAFLHYLGMSIRVDLVYQVLTGAIMTGVWLLSGKRKDSPLSSITGDWFHILALAFDTVVILWIAFANWDSTGEFLAASVTVVLLAAVLSQWSKQYTNIRLLIPLILYPLTIAARGMLCQADITFLKYDMIVFLFLLAVVAWDLMERDRFEIPILVIGTAAELLFWVTGRNLPLFALLLSGYLFIKSCRAEEDMREWYEKGGCLYLLAGIFFITGSLTETFLIRMFCVTVVFAAEYAVLHWYRKEESHKQYWEVTGVILLLLNMAAFYLDHSLALGYIIPCLIIFVVFYIMFYRSGSKWAHLLAAVSVLPMPQIAAYRYALTEHQLYGFTAVAILASGILIRRYLPIITCQGDDSKEWKFDWLHILVILVLIPMTLAAGDGWRCVYLILIALYVLQYTAVGMLYRKALSIASALVVLAFWSQPFIQFPELIQLELQLIPAVLFIWYMGYVWKDKKIVFRVQTVLYCLCLASLIIDALLTGLVIDALILEVVCLSVFIWANIKRNVLWLRISGTVIVVVALYMTKGFWLSLSWWVYLLAAGLGLIVFAAINEIKKQ